VPSSSAVADLEMVYLNSDGSTSEMCGNGIRCLARYARDFEIVEGDALTIETGAGVQKVLLFDDGSSRVDMGPPAFGGEAEFHGFRFRKVSMGNPHAVAFLGSEEEVEALDLRAVGRGSRNGPSLPRQNDVEFAYARGPGEVRMRIWERGAGETLASGSGSCAVAVAAIRSGSPRAPSASFSTAARSR
jgi:diaminopimelate epimerase